MILPHAILSEYRWLYHRGHEFRGVRCTTVWYYYEGDYTRSYRCWDFVSGEEEEGQTAVGS